MAGVWCTCDEWDKYFKEILGAQLLAWNHGARYKGKPFRFCPWCGKTLERAGGE